MQLSTIERWREELTAEELTAAFQRMTLSERQAVFYSWKLWRRPAQAPPTWDWSTWLVLAGRGFGKTRVGAEQVRQWIKEGFSLVNLIAATADDLRDVLVEGESGILAVCPRDERPVYRVSKRRLEWPNGARSLLFTAEEPDRLRGKQHQKLWMDELASWKYAKDAFDMAQFGLRLGKNPQSIITTTPRPTSEVRELIDQSKSEIDDPSKPLIDGKTQKLIRKPTVAVTRGTTYENRANLAPKFYTHIITKYENTRLGRQELNAEVLDDNPGALFKLSDINGARVSKLPPLIRIVVALDPATTSTEESDEWGIVAAGMDGRYPPHFYVLKDLSEIYTPDEAAKQAITLLQLLGADRVIGEANNGGDMIETILRYQDANVPYKKVTASRGKVIRAEPISALYEQHRVHHHGTLSKLEDELTQWNPLVDKESPNRLDADVWALTELASGTDWWEQYAKSEVRKMEEEGSISSTPETGQKLLVDGRSTDQCECGSKFWTGVPGSQRCYKCGKERPKK